MTIQRIPIFGLRAPRRLAAALAAITIATSVVSALLLAFNAASPAAWLAATPQVTEMTAECDRLPGRQSRDSCKQQLVTALLAHEPPVVRLARR